MVNYTNSIYYNMNFIAMKKILQQNSFNKIILYYTILANRESTRESLVRDPAVKF